ncbi:hypothetical protein BA915_07840, partial [Helicobacter pullorum]
MNKKRLAICLFGHLRTYEKTHQNFFRNIVEPNLKDGWEIDIFMHTWDRLSSSQGSWHKEIVAFDERGLSDDEITRVKEIYKPKAISIETLPDGVYGQPLTLRRVNEIRENYEKEEGIKYDYILYTRCDLLFVNPLRISIYLDEYKKYPSLKLPLKHCFCGVNIFFRMSVLDMRYINEGDLIYFSNCSLYNFSGGSSRDGQYVIPINYILYRDFFIQREDFIHGENNYPLVRLQKSFNQQSQQLTQTKKQLDIKIKELDSKSQELESLKFQYDSKIKELQVNLKTTQDSLSSLPIKKQTLEIKNLESDLKIKVLKAKQIEKELGYSYNVLEELDLKKQELIKVKQQLDSKTKQLESKNTGLESNLNYPIFKGNLSYLNTMTSAKDRIHNHLSYKLGKAMIENSKSILGYIRMPYVLSYIKEQHNKEQKQYQEQIKKNPNLKLPKLESYK